jgi:hypothetical protein
VEQFDDTVAVALRDLILIARQLIGEEEFVIADRGGFEAQALA